MHQRKIVYFLIPALLLATAYAYHLLLRTAPVSILDSQQLKFVGDCVLPSIDEQLEQPEFLVAASSGGACVSEWFQPLSSSIRYEFAGYPNFSADSGLFLESKAGDSVKIPTPKVFPAHAWKRAEFRIASTDSQYRIRLKSTTEAWVAMRPLIEWYAVSDSLISLRSYLAAPARAKVLQLFFSLLLSVVVLLSLRVQGWARVSLYFLLALVMHARFDVFFLDDDWSILSALARNPIASITQAHNEHFIPLFQLLVSLQYSLFSSHYFAYLFVSLTLHVLNSFVLARVLRGFLPGVDALVPDLIAVLYLIAGVHAEALQWMAVQGQGTLLLCALSALWALQYWGRTRPALALLIAGICSLAAPLFFASGLLVALHLLLASLFLLAGRQRKCAAILFACVLVFTTALYVFSGVRATPGYTMLFDDPAYIPRTLSYLLVALIPGTLGRAFGLSQATPASHAVLSQFSLWQLIELYAVPLLLIAVSVILIPPFLLRQAEGRKALSLFFFGVFWMLTTLALPALARAMLGSSHGLTLRYQSYTLPGLCFALLPLFGSLHTLVCCRERRLRPRITLSMSFLALLFVVHSQVVFSGKVKRFWRVGAPRYQWFERVAALERIRRENPAAEVLHYSVHGTRQAAPVSPGQLRALFLSR